MSEEPIDFAARARGFAEKADPTIAGIARFEEVMRTLQWTLESRDRFMAAVSDLRRELGDDAFACTLWGMMVGQQKGVPTAEDFAAIGVSPQDVDETKSRIKRIRPEWLQE